MRSFIGRDILSLKDFSREDLWAVVFSLFASVIVVMAGGILMVMARGF